ncbi:4-carboxymuconolactone decarboxylase, putative [Trichomonas vaginalis G3]|uniref:4-carboxymuconolactone decarboxylase, putative n=1 Tax=Trichomonas vaginalis (strain ATCC PRA-98 / G3) TaxID=412133 RepID=A2FE49_TRIV3|nr:4-carboxymuconolactone decarboxylase family protein family [Trichomonas vaginalis G3]EAX96821.1 4-carboxymuconolactone decarboxylase, putative [Trichomonas vaginalis G3]KAI5536682.1 4-carboxymuconolactone decarboxylase family protein family [Trichomonas vaginalis G3]|eukprot:XP_001309751.1 4-carboxymuconolactone decarboxylase [Trichomonas vaginalis G3]
MSNYKEVLDELEHNDPEYFEFFYRFEKLVQSETKIDEKNRYLGILGSLIGSKSIDYYPYIIEQVLTKILTPQEIKEVLYEAAFILGASTVYPFLKVTNDIFKQHNINLPLENQCKVSPEEALKKGIEKQKESFGPGMEDFHTKGPMNKWVVTFMYGQLYTREVLTVKQREIVITCIFIGYGDATPQFLQHVKALTNLGHGKWDLIQMILSLVPYIGYPRTFNALRAINEAVPDPLYMKVMKFAKGMYGSIFG